MKITLNIDGPPSGDYSREVAEALDSLGGRWQLRIRCPLVPAPRLEMVP